MIYFPRMRWPLRHMVKTELIVRVLHRLLYFKTVNDETSGSGVRSGTVLMIFFNDRLCQMIRLQTFLILQPSLLLSLCIMDS